MTLIETVDLRDIEAFVTHEDQSCVFALKLYNKPDVLIESPYRSEILFHLISLFENKGFKKFKIYSSKNISVK